MLTANDGGDGENEAEGSRQTEKEKDQTEGDIVWRKETERVRKRERERRLIAGPPSPALCVCHHPPDSPPCYITPSRRPRFFI